VSRLNESHGETVPRFAESPKEEEWSKSSREDFTKFRGSLDLAEVQGGYGRNVWKDSKLRRGRALIQVNQDRWIIREIAYRDLVRKAPEIW
jgi:hypothetical protein